jgi:hypothetical protein
MFAHRFAHLRQLLSLNFFKPLHLLLLLLNLTISLIQVCHLVMHHIHLLEPQVQVPVLLALTSVDPYHLSILIIFDIALILALDPRVFQLLLLLRSTRYLLPLKLKSFVARTDSLLLISKVLFSQLKLLHCSVICKHIMSTMYYCRIFPFLLDNLISLC